MSAIFLTILHILTFFSVGLLCASILEHKNIVSKHFIVISAYGVSCFIGYLLFYVYLISPGAGRACTIVFYSAGVLSFIGLLYWLAKSIALRKVYKVAVVPVLIIIFSLATLYSAITFPCQYRKVDPASPYMFYQTCVLYDSTGDNIIAQFFGQKIIDNREHDLMGDWHLADRPPLEIGSLISLLDVTGNTVAQRSAYEFFSIILQLSWVAGLWALLSMMRAKARDRYFVIFVSAITGFYYYNSIYAWPKLLSAAFALAGLGLLVYHQPRERTASMKNWLVATIFFVLSVLAHDSSLFILIPVALYIIFSKKLPSFKILFLCLAAVLCLYGPWAVYKQANTSSDRLVKWHLAGVPSASDHRSAPQAIIDSYKSITLKHWLHGKAESVGFLFNADYSQYLVHVAKDPSEHSFLDKVRKQEFFAIFPALGLLNLGWLVLIFKKLRVVPTQKEFATIRPLLIISGVGMVLWVMLLFTPQSDVNHQNSYALIMLLFTILALSIAQAKRYLKSLVIILQPISFYLVWVYGLYKINGHLGTLIPVTVLLTIYIFAAVRWYRKLRPQP